MKPTCPVNGKTQWKETLHILKLNKNLSYGEALILFLTVLFVAY